MDEDRNPRVLQIFLDSKHGVVEVFTDDCDHGTHRRLRCTCPDFPAKESCVHAAAVYRLLASSKNGVYLSRIYRDIPDEEVSEASQDWKKMRSLLAEYAEIFVVAEERGK